MNTPQSERTVDPSSGREWVRSSQSMKMRLRLRGSPPRPSASRPRRSPAAPILRMGTRAGQGCLPRVASPAASSGPRPQPTARPAPPGRAGDPLTLEGIFFPDPRLPWRLKFSACLEAHDAPFLRSTESWVLFPYAVSHSWRSWCLGDWNVRLEVRTTRERCVPLAHRANGAWPSGCGILLDPGEGWVIVPSIQGGQRL